MPHRKSPEKMANVHSQDAQRIGQTNPPDEEPGDFCAAWAYGIIAVVAIVLYLGLIWFFVGLW